MRNAFPTVVLFDVAARQRKFYFINFCFKILYHDNHIFFNLITDLRHLDMHPTKISIM